MLPEGFIIRTESSSEHRGVSGAWSNSTKESVWLRFVAFRSVSTIAAQFKLLVPNCAQRVGAENPPRDAGMDSVRELIDSQRQVLDNMLWDAVRTSGQ